MLALIAAVARNGAIGRNQQLLWHLPADLRHFRQTTNGKPVIMGRKTWESLPTAFRPLPGRHNIVLSRTPAYPASGATLAASLDAALRLVESSAEAFVIGGADLYRQALPLAGRVYLTEIDENADADAFFPELPAGDWQLVAREQPADAQEPPFSFAVYERRPPGGVQTTAPTTVPIAEHS